MTRLIEQPDRRQGSPDPRSAGSPERRAPREVDATIENLGGVFVVQPLTVAARDWLEDNGQAAPWQWFGGALCLDDRRYARDLVNGMVDDGLVVRAQTEGGSR